MFIKVSLVKTYRITERKAKKNLMVVMQCRYLTFSFNLSKNIGIKEIVF